MPLQQKSRNILLDDVLVRRVASTVAGVPPHRLITDIARAFKVSAATVRRRMKALVSAGRFGYAQHHGQPKLVMGRHHPIPVGGRFVLVPEQWQGPVPQGEPPGGQLPPISIRLAEGAAFGDGAHPTTRLALTAIAILHESPEKPEAEWRILDVGTGTGVLLLGAVQAMDGTGIGIDLDPTAVVEARYNAALNDVSDQVIVTDTPIDALTGSYDLILANLRPPTLVGLCAEMDSLLASKGYLLLTGGRPEEMASVIHAYMARGFTPTWQAEDLDWGAAMLRRHKKEEKIAL